MVKSPPLLSWARATQAFEEDGTAELGDEAFVLLEDGSSFLVGGGGNGAMAAQEEGGVPYSSASAMAATVVSVTEAAAATASASSTAELGSKYGDEGVARAAAIEAVASHELSDLLELELEEVAGEGDLATPVSEPLAAAVSPVAPSVVQAAADSDLSAVTLRPEAVPPPASAAPPQQQQLVRSTAVVQYFNPLPVLPSWAVVSTLPALLC
jgi:hypothetical protein